LRTADDRPEPALDFVINTLMNGRRFRIRAVVDEMPFVSASACARTGSSGDPLFATHCWVPDFAGTNGRFNRRQIGVSVADCF
jgi:hypothetical protein